jgi:serpin B
MKSLSTLSCLFAALIIGCSSEQPSSPATPATTGVGVLKADVARDTAPQVPASDLATLTAGNTAFAFDMYHRVAPAEGNMVFSPYSISIALAMTYAGSRGATEQAMASTMHFTLSQQALHPAFNSLDLALASRGANAAGREGAGFKLSIVNALWAQAGYPFQTDYLNSVGLNYGAGIRLVDFVQLPEVCRDTINGWVESETQGKIVDLLAPGTITSSTRMVLTNAIYFDAAWASKFTKEVTRDRPFTTASSAVISVPTMHQEGAFAYYRGTSFAALALPYDGNELDMVIVLPDSGGFASVAQEFSAQGLAAVTAGLQPQQVSLSLPKFTFTAASLSLADVLKAMGMTVAFTGAADFSGMVVPPEAVAISDVIHKAFVAVDEAGTTAAAATAVIMVRTVSIVVTPPPVPFVVDRPFLFFIRDVATGSILFMGQITDPSQP